MLFCSSVLLKDPEVIPFDEVIFYVFAAVSLSDVPLIMLLLLLITSWAR